MKVAGRCLRLGLEGLAFAGDNLGFGDDGMLDGGVIPPYFFFTSSEES